ncbi:MAG TPA: CvpA family protein [Chloroflexia bacterium]|nr:CvpA family protein [Chloroflexia bacterium]
MSVLDIIILVILVGMTLVSAVWGLVRQAIAVGGLIAGIWLASAFSTNVAGWLGFVNDPKVAKSLAFVLIIVVVSLIASTVASILYFVVGLLFLGPLDHLLGALLGLIQGILVVGIFMIGALTLFPDWTQQQLAVSSYANQVAQALTKIPLTFAPQELKTIVDNALQNVKK